MKKFTIALLLLVAALTLAACGRRNEITFGGDDGVVIIGATAVPHMEILEQVLPILLEQGFDVELQEFDNFIAPNIALNDGEICINFFQHRPFLNNFNEENDASLVPVFGVHFEPLRVFAGRLDSLDNIPEGAEIAIPEDPSNQARALQLLEYLGLLTLRTDVSPITATTGIAQNPHNLNIRTLTAQILPQILSDVDFAVINGNFALQGGVMHLAIDGASEEDNPAAIETFTNFVVVREGYENSAAVLALVDAINTQEIRDFIANQYGGRVVPTFIRP